MAPCFDDLRRVVAAGDVDAARKQAQELLRAGHRATTVLADGLVPAMQTVAELWQSGDYFLPDVVLAAEAFQQVMNLLAADLGTEGAGRAGKVLVGVVRGDMHDLGKNLVVAMLRSAGFIVEDMGVDVRAEDFLARVKEWKPDIVGLGAYMTTTVPVMKDVIGQLEREGLRSSVRVMVGGVPLTQHMADELGADAWGRDALDAVAKAKQLMGVN